MQGKSLGGALQPPSKHVSLMDKLRHNGAKATGVVSSLPASLGQ